MTSPYLPEEDSVPPSPPPWGFRLTLVALVVYLGYRLVQGVVWLVRWVSG